MNVSRRDFLKYCIGSAAALGLDLSAIGAIEKALAGGGPPIIWLNGANCTGCTVSLANRVGTSSPVDVADLLINTINLVYHPNLMGAAGDLAVETLQNTVKSGNYVLAVDGGIPTAFGGHACMLWTENGKDITALAAVKRLAPAAKAILAIGTCASFGGIPGGKPNPTRIRSVGAVAGRPTINLPGCPVHPDWVVLTIAQLLKGNTPRLDSNGRPRTFFGGRALHESCPRNGGDWATTLGMDGKCLRGLGCKGPSTHADCPTRQWNNQTNWCIGANAICIGCTENGFPDRFSPFYSSTGVLPGDHESVNTRKACIECHGRGGDDD